MYKALMGANSQEFKIVCMQSGYGACSSLYYLKKIVSFSEIHGAWSQVRTNEPWRFFLSTISYFLKKIIFNLKSPLYLTSSFDIF